MDANINVKNQATGINHNCFSYYAFVIVIFNDSNAKS